MQYQTFRGSDVREALSHVRAALGADAMIESTRQVSNGRAGALAQSFVEIVAAPSILPPLAPRFSVKQKNSSQISSRDALRAQPQSRELGAGAPEAAFSDVGRELSQLRMMLDELTQGRPPRDRTRALLSAAGFEGALARELATSSTRAARAGNRQLRGYLRQRVADKLRCRSGLIDTPERKIIACVGPTGVGKTTTLAKLAARAVLEFGRRVRVVSLDTYRVGAVEQWRRYSELIGLSFDVATNPGTFHRVVHKSAEDLILVDTPGRGVGEQHSLLAGCLTGLRDLPAEVLLVLPAWLRARDAERMLANHSVPPPTAVVITKLDEAEQVGGVMHAPLDGDLPISYLCDGARVPEDIHDAVQSQVLDAIFPEQA